MQSEHILLSNGIRWPLLGFGTWKIPDGEAVIKAVQEALHTGYRLIDTATLYANESGIGEALRHIELYREDYCITTKLWNSDQGYDATLRAFDLSQKKLELEYIDAYLIHWPMPEVDLYLESWRALERLYDEGRVKAIGVSNFERPHLQRLIDNCQIKPMLNQVECHLGLQQQELLHYCQNEEIVMQGWRPLANGLFNHNEAVADIANRHQKSSQQVMLRFLIQQGIGAIPKTTSPTRMLENISLFNFVLTDAEMALLRTLDGTCARQGFDPNLYNDRTYSR